jgi:hypothetical protein
VGIRNWQNGDCRLIYAIQKRGVFRMKAQKWFGWVLGLAMMSGAMAQNISIATGGTGGVTTLTVAVWLRC